MLTKSQDVRNLLSPLDCCLKGPTGIDAEVSLVSTREDGTYSDNEEEKTQS
jgi:hypothetical protein